MNKNILPLEIVAKKYGEDKIGIEKSFTPQNNYFISNLSRTRDYYSLIDRKIHMTFNFKGRNQPNSFGHFKSQSGYNNKLKLTNFVQQNHLGEYLGFLILAQLEKKVCKVDIGTAEIRNKYSGKVIEIPGCLSHLQTSCSESFKSISVILEEFNFLNSKIDENGELNENKNYYFDTDKVNIETILDALKILYKDFEQECRIPEILKSIFDMCVFDIKFANVDRHDENFGLKINQLTNELSPYPLFDNEQILGFSIPEECIEETNDIDSKSFEKIYEKVSTSYLGFPKNNKPSSLVFFKYLLTNHYEETVQSYLDFARYKLSDLEEAMNAIPNISEKHKWLAKNIFIKREKEMNQILKEVNVKRLMEGRSIKSLKNEDIGYFEPSI